MLAPSYPTSRENGMKTCSGPFKQITKLGFLLMVELSTTACTSSIEWGQEVQLSDDRVIVMERGTVREAGGGEWAFNRSGSKPNN